MKTKNKRNSNGPIQWPATWPASEGFPTDADTKPLTTETRTWGELDQALQSVARISTTSRIAAMGGSGDIEGDDEARLDDGDVP